MRLGPSQPTKQAARPVIIGIGFLMVLWAILPISAQAEGKFALPHQTGLLPCLQKALGKEWSVVAIPEGYLLTYVQPVVLYSPVPLNLKMGIQQRIAQGRPDYMRIKILFFVRLQ
jgi:hypothetical protein